MAEILIKDAFPKETLMIQKYLYSQTIEPSKRQRLVKMWDKFELLIENPITNEQKLNTFLNILGVYSEEAVEAAEKKLIKKNKKSSY